MKSPELAKIAEIARCRLIGWQDAGNDGHRLTLATLIRAFDRSESAILCEPSLARSSKRPPDLVLIDPEIGVHVLEVKSVTLDMIESVQAGGEMRIRYPSGVRSRNPVVQVRNAMFDVKDATVRAFCEDIRVRFEYWVVFPLIRRQDWISRFDVAGFRPPEFLFSGDLDPAQLAIRMGATDRLRSVQPIELCPLDQLACVWRAFGDTSVLYATPETRPPRRVREGTLGEHFDEAAEALKTLSDDQQRLSAMYWESGPRLIRGVAGSGKTIVLANNLARRVQRLHSERGNGLFQSNAPRPRVLAVCFNRTLAPHLSQKIATAYQQRTGESLPDGAVEVCHFNGLLWQLSVAGLWRYQRMNEADDVTRANRYSAELDRVRNTQPDRVRDLSYDAIYVDEGQDFLEEEFRLLKDLCRFGEGGEPSLYVFYDDAQNLYGRGKPNWLSLGLNVRGGRAFRMKECFRNNHPIIETAFNVLYGSHDTAGDIPTREFGDVQLLEKDGLVEFRDGRWRVRFAQRAGEDPTVCVEQGESREAAAVIARLKWLLEVQQVRPQDILVLAYSKERVRKFAEQVAAARLPGVDSVHVPIDGDEKNQPLMQRQRLTISTVASAKGYDAYCVLLISANEFPADVKGRVSFYVGCSRAIEHLEVSAYAHVDLAREFASVLKARRGG